MPSSSAARPVLLPVAALITVLLIAAPVLAAKPDKADKAPELARTMSGVVTSAEDAKGRATFAMTVGGVTWELSAGPKWFWGASNPLAAYVGRSVEVVGTYHAGETELDVDTVDGKALRAPGKPPWAGGWKVVGKSHPGWKEGKLLKSNGRQNAPGQLKDKTRALSAD